MTTQTEISFYEKNLDTIINPAIDLCSPDEFGVYPFGEAMLNKWLEQQAATKDKIRSLQFQVNPINHSDHIAKKYPKTYRRVA